MDGGVVGFKWMILDVSREYFGFGYAAGFGWDLSGCWLWMGMVQHSELACDMGLAVDGIQAGCGCVHFGFGICGM